jgi:hypothetical protein
VTADAPANGTALIRASVREWLEAWQLQSEAGPVTVEAPETILARATVPTLRQVEERQPELARALLPKPGPHDARGLRGSGGGAMGIEGVVLRRAIRTVHRRSGVSCILAMGRVLSTAALALAPLLVAGCIPTWQEWVTPDGGFAPVAECWCRCAPEAKVQECMRIVQAYCEEREFRACMKDKGYKQKFRWEPMFDIGPVMPFPAP